MTRITRRGAQPLIQILLTDEDPRQRLQLDGRLHLVVPYDSGHATLTSLLRSPRRQPTQLGPFVSEEALGANPQ